MKQNLETLKKILDENAVWLEMPMTRKVIQWESEFEKELREILKDAEECMQGNPEIYVTEYGAGKAFLAKQILGVEPKVKEETKR